MIWERQKVVWQINNFSQETISEYSEGDPVKSRRFLREKDLFGPAYFELYPENGELVLRIVPIQFCVTQAELSLKVIAEMRLNNWTNEKKIVKQNHQEAVGCGFRGHFNLLRVEDIPKEYMIRKKFERILTLVVHVELKDSGGRYDKRKIRGEKYYGNTVADVIGSLLNSRDFSDVKIICSDGIEIPAHRGVLAMRSPVFKAMLTSEMVEQNSGTITIDDIDGETMKYMLLFLYKGLIGTDNNPWGEDPWINSLAKLGYELSSKLLYAAEKYDLPALKKICGMNLNSSIGMENVISILLTAEKFHKKNVKDDCLRFIAVHFTQLQNTDDWKLLNSTLVTEIMKVMKEMEDETVPLVNTL